MSTTKIFTTKYGSAIASSARGPCYFRPQTDITISVIREVRVCTVLTKPVSTLEVHETNWRCLHSSASTLSEALPPAWCDHLSIPHPGHWLLCRQTRESSLTGPIRFPQVPFQYPRSRITTLEPNKVLTYTKPLRRPDCTLSRLPAENTTGK